EYGWQITSVFDTHIHADHLSRSRQLAERSGALLFLPDQQRVSFPFTTIRDGDMRALPGLLLTALHTPGHTMESTCYLLNNQVLFTGDTLFPTGVGRPDLRQMSSRREYALPRSTTACTSCSRSPRTRSCCRVTPVRLCHLMS